MLQRSALSLFLLLTLAQVALAKVWFVGGTGADFDQIQPAIDAAQNGDVILVRAGPLYNHFTLDKGVVVRASDSPFTVISGQGDLHVTVTSIPFGERAAISGMITSDAVLVTGSAGEVVLEDVRISLTFAWFDDHYDANCLTISSCNNVSLSGLHATSGTGVYYCGTQSPAVAIQASSVRISGKSSITAADGVYGYNCNDWVPGVGGIGLQALGSTLVLSNVNVRGGDGGDGVDGDVFFPFGSPGGAGGAGISAKQSEVVLLGATDELVRGGDGGKAGWNIGDGKYNKGGDGGGGLVLTSGGSARVSRTALAGGTGGEGDPPGADGAPSVGNVTRDDRYPFFLLDGRINPGDLVSFTVNSVEPGVIALLVSQHGGFYKDPAYVGAPFVVLPGGFFFAVPVGHTSGGSDFTVSAPLVNDPALRGFVINAQALVLADSGTNFLSNGVSRIIGE
jgi:hypothetical protein